MTATHAAANDAEAPAAPPRHAATLLMFDRRGPAPRVLMGQRRATARFMPSVAVFPGGGVDPADFDTVPARPLDALTLAHLSRTASPQLAHALAVAAARELQEETNLSLGEPPALHAMRYLCRAITPAGRPIRFDTRFLTVDVADLDISFDDVVLLEDGELEHLGWRTLDEAAALTLAPPTRGALDMLRQRLSAASLWPPEPHSPLPVLMDTRGWVTE